MMIDLVRVLAVMNYNIKQLEVDHLILLDKYHDYSFDDQIEMMMMMNIHDEDLMNYAMNDSENDIHYFYEKLNL
jgi:hypothetical protein